MEPLEGELLMEHVLRNSSVQVFDPHIKPLMELLADKLLDNHQAWNCQC